MSQQSSSKRIRLFARDPLTDSDDGSPASGGDDHVPASVMLPVPNDDDRVADDPLPLTPSKAAMVLGLLTREEGARIDELIAVTGWLPHTTRAALTGLRKKGHTIVREKVDGITRYAIKPVTPE